MTDDERAAREWLLKAYNDIYMSAEDARHRATILRLLDRPVMPKGSEVPDYVILLMIRAWAARRTGDSVGAMRAAIDVLHAHLTAPPAPAKVEAWGVLYPNGQSVFTHDRETAVQCSTRGSRIVRLVEAADADA